MLDSKYFPITGLLTTLRKLTLEDSFTKMEVGAVILSGKHLALEKDNAVPIETHKSTEAGSQGIIILHHTGCVLGEN